MKTVITELLGIEYPVIQGGMAWSSMGLNHPSLLPLFPKPVDLESLVRAVHLLLGWKNRFIK